jgi:hypothetical protein
MHEAFAVSTENAGSTPRDRAVFERSRYQKICVITPYFKEDRALIERSLISVKRQTVAADHILVADGFPQAWIDEYPVRHVKLDRAHADYGNVARGVAALMAVAESYGAIAFLDADNWFEEDHLETCLMAAVSAPSAPFVVAQRNYVRPDASVMNLGNMEDMPLGDHIDTNCYFFLPPAYPLLHYWCAFPQEFSAQGDRLFRQILGADLSMPPAITAKRTVNYTCMYESLYRIIGETPPEGAKPDLDWAPGLAWLKTLSGRDLALVDRLSGLSLSKLADGST